MAHYAVLVSFEDDYSIEYAITMERPTNAEGVIAEYRRLGGKGVVEFVIAYTDGSQDDETAVLI